MQVEMLISRAGPGGVANRGDIIEVGKEEAVRMIEAGQAIPVRDERKVEKAVRKPRK